MSVAAASINTVMGFMPDDIEKGGKDFVKFTIPTDPFKWGPFFKMLNLCYC